MEKKSKLIMGVGTGLLLTMSGVSQIQVNPDPIPVNEWRNAVEMYQYEMDKNGGSITVEDFNDIQDLNDKIRTRVPTETVEMNNQTLSPTEYMIEREKLLDKTEKQTLLEKIIN